MRGRLLLAAMAFLAGLALAVVPSLGATQSVSAGGSSDVFSPATVTVSVGDSVEWTNAGGTHNVSFDDNSFRQPATPVDSAWKVSRTFTTPGTFHYQCDLHGPFGMTGTVVVLPQSGTGPPPPPGGGPPPPAGVLRDKVAPRLSLGGPGSQRVLRKGRLVVSARVDERARLTASGRIAVPRASRVLRLRKVTRRAAANTRVKLTLRLSRKTRAAVISALAHRARLRARVTVVATDSAGNSRSSTRTVRVTK
jgi:plastocyanin